jgi:succinoglycan biosynthesis transport protein ExoP
MKIGITNKEDFIALIVRRKWWIMLPFLALSGVGILLTYCLPNTYVSQTLIQVRPREVSETYVVDLIAGSSQQRLRSIEQTILSRTNMVAILDEFGHRLIDSDSQSIDQRVGRLSEQIDITFQTASGRNGDEILSFNIAYQNQDPGLAQEIAQKLATLFILQDARARETQVSGNTEFFAGELAKVEQELALAEAQLEAVRRRNRFTLPEQFDANVSRLDQLLSQQQANEEALDRYVTNRMNLERQISETPQTLAAAEVEVTTVVDPTVADYRAAKTAYDDLIAKGYTADHPSVRTALLRLENLEAQLPAGTDTATATAPAGPVPNPAYSALLSQLQVVQTELRIREEQRQELDAQIRDYSRRVENTPAAQQELSEVLRRYNDVQAEHDELQEILSDMQLSQSLEDVQKGAQFEIVDPANYPDAPTKPNKLSLFLGSIFGSFGLALAFAVVVDVLRQKVWTQAEIENFWGVEVLIDIPQILTDDDLADRRKAQAALAASSVVGTCAYLFCLYFIYIVHEAIFWQFDPLIQQLIY